MFFLGYLEGGIDTCAGNSGGSLVCEINGMCTYVKIDLNFGYKIVYISSHKFSKHGLLVGNKGIHLFSKYWLTA